MLGLTSPATAALVGVAWVAMVALARLGVRTPAAPTNVDLAIDRYVNDPDAEVADLERDLELALGRTVEVEDQYGRCERVRGGPCRVCAGGGECALRGEFLERARAEEKRKATNHEPPWLESARPYPDTLTRVWYER